MESSSLALRLFAPPSIKVDRLMAGVYPGCEGVMKYNLALGMDVSGAQGNLAGLYMQICGDPACKICTHSLYSIISNLAVAIKLVLQA
jgi:hypothetical protein